MSRAARLTANDREVLIRHVPEMSRAMDAVVLLMRRREELHKAEQRHALHGIRCKRHLDEAIAREQDAMRAVRQTLVEYWCQPEE